MDNRQRGNGQLAMGNRQKSFWIEEFLEKYQQTNSTVNFQFAAASNLGLPIAYCILPIAHFF
jgi:hypothetical protein